jgi:hypothetical protein
MLEKQMPRVTSRHLFFVSLQFDGISVGIQPDPNCKEFWNGAYKKA